MGIEFDGVVLAAGRSTRMGRDKALVPAASGTPRWQRQRDVLVAAGANDVYLSARPDQAWARTAAGFAGILHDALPGCGPLVGLTAALERSGRSHVAVLAIDLPEMPAEWLRRLAAASASGLGVVGRRADLFEPLAAVYPREFKWLAWEALAGGRYALQPLLRQAVADRLLQVVEIGAGEQLWFDNRNTPPERPADA